MLTEKYFRLRKIYIKEIRNNPKSLSHRRVFQRSNIYEILQRYFE